MNSKRRWWIVGVVLLTAAAVLSGILPRERIPSYGGRSATDWLRDVFGSQNATGQGAAIDAFREMGAHGTVFLVGALGYHETLPRAIYRRIYVSVPALIRRGWHSPESQDTLANAASLVLMNVRDADPQRTFPNLVRLLASPHPRTRLYAAGVVEIYALNYRELDLAPYRSQFMAASHDTNIWIQRHMDGVLTAAHLAHSLPGTSSQTNVTAR